MSLQFPANFIFGTSTASAQIETAFDHDWSGVKSRDGYIFNRTTDHELNMQEDVNIIASLAPNYRMGLMWSKLQKAPFAEFDKEAILHYHTLLTHLADRGVRIMMVLHHFTNPNWFVKNGGWENEENIPLWLDFVKKLLNEFGHYVTLWNTFNEPNVYVSNGWLLRAFPPFKQNLFKAIAVVKNMGKAHDLAVDLIKEKFPNHPVGISHNATLFESHNILGSVPAKISDYWHMEFIPRHFTKVDFFGMSYYARVTHDPFPITYMHAPEKILKYKKEHDDMWEYHPEGMRTCVLRYWNEFKKPIIITENGVCSADDTLRVRAIKDYMAIIHTLIAEGVDIKGYYHWSAWDNFEWNLGPSYRFGLYACDIETKVRSKRPSADLYSSLAHTGQLQSNANLNPAEPVEIH